MVFGAYLTLGLLVFTGCVTDSKRPPSSSLPSLVETLRPGGHVIYMRHVNADVGRDVPGPGEWWKKCGEGHRMLSERGRAQAVQIGKEIRRLNIPISEVRSSEYCRAVETARLLGFGEPKSDARLNGWPVWKAVDPEHGLERLAEGTRVLLATRPIQGNVMLVSHKQDFPHSAAPVLAELEDGECAVFSPDGKDGFVLIGRIKPEEWKALGN
jgi:phosphohistidine phosphatase SixA